jgi:hypothetical protein
MLRQPMLHHLIISLETPFACPNFNPGAPAAAGRSGSQHRRAHSQMAALQRRFCAWACLAILLMELIPISAVSSGHHRPGAQIRAEDYVHTEELDGTGAAHLRVLCSRTRGSWCWRFHKQPELAGHKQPYVPGAEKQCQNDCGGVGNCNYDTGLCDCPAGEAPSRPLWVAGGPRRCPAAAGPAASPLQAQATALQAASWPRKLQALPGNWCQRLRTCQWRQQYMAPTCLPAGFKGSDCSVPDPRPCTNRHAGEAEDHPVGHIDEAGRDRNTSAEGWTASRCGGEP